MGKYINSWMDRGIMYAWMNLSSPKFWYIPGPRALCMDSCSESQADQNFISVPILHMNSESPNFWKIKMLLSTRRLPYGASKLPRVLGKLLTSTLPASPLSLLSLWCALCESDLLLPLCCSSFSSTLTFLQEKARSLRLCIGLSLQKVLVLVTPWFECED